MTIVTFVGAVTRRQGTVTQLHSLVTSVDTRNRDVNEISRLRVFTIFVGSATVNKEKAPIGTLPK